MRPKDLVEVVQRVLRRERDKGLRATASTRVFFCAWRECVVRPYLARRLGPILDTG
jgi:hypothetical protein